MVVVTIKDNFFLKILPSFKNKVNLDLIILQYNINQPTLWWNLHKENEMFFDN